MKKLTRLIVIAFALSLVLIPMTTASANESEQIEQFRAMLDEQDALDTSGAASKDRQLAREWLQEAEVLVANGKEKAARQRLRRVEFAVELVSNLVAAALIRQKAEEQEASAFGAPDTAEQLQLEVEQLRKQKTALQTELSKLRQQNAQ